MNPQQTVLFRVCAVIVTYHPSADMLENISRIAAQVQGIVVVDNGSNLEELEMLRIASHVVNFHLIENGENLGIAEALNQGVRWAEADGFPWVILFDQDSRITPSFIEQLFADWKSHPERERIAGMNPKYVNPVTGLEAKVFRASDGGPFSSMTSGTLMPTWVFDKIGWFPSEYFIDQVDTEYGYRIRAAGYINADSRQAVLLHVPGQPGNINLLGFSFRLTHHNAIRRYYLTRNRIAVYKKYFSIFPSIVLRSMYLDLRETAKCFLFEKDRIHKFRNLLLGIRDGLIGRMGKRDGL